jgi:hypothetical protein
VVAQGKSGNRSRTISFVNLLRLRGEVGRLRKDVQELMQLKSAGSRREVMCWHPQKKVWSERVNELRQWLEGNLSERFRN